mmetsp:Transcript_8172/g.24275  ORF Transcript_8172/g.24275 Transcript_8172/m.24275 type:complete len:258 (+) Transcript_8172:2893-3666(+)
MARHVSPHTVLMHMVTPLSVRPVTLVPVFAMASVVVVVHAHLPRMQCAVVPHMVQPLVVVAPEVALLHARPAMLMLAAPVVAVAVHAVTVLVVSVVVIPAFVAIAMLVLFQIRLVKIFLVVVISEVLRVQAVLIGRGLGVEPGVLQVLQIDFLGDGVMRIPVQVAPARPLLVGVLRVVPSPAVHRRRRLCLQTPPPLGIVARSMALHNALHFREAFQLALHVAHLSCHVRIHAGLVRGQHRPEQHQGKHGCSDSYQH